MLLKNKRCGGTTGCGCGAAAGLTCSPCPIPLRDLTLTINYTSRGGGIYVKALRFRNNTVQFNVGSSQRLGPPYWYTDCYAWPDIFTGVYGDQARSYFSCKGSIGNAVGDPVRLIDSIWNDAPNCPGGYTQNTPPATDTSFGNILFTRFGGYDTASLSCDPLLIRWIASDGTTYTVTDPGA